MSMTRADRATKRGAELAAELAPRRAAGWAESLRKLRDGLPVLAKDLTELAARRRTYIVRAVYAGLLFLIFAASVSSGLAEAGRNPAAALGIGGDFFMVIFGLQVGGVYLLLPAMMAGCIAEEKEKRTLELLFVTDLTPGEIVMQKLVGRLVPMLTLLLLSLPLMAVCYALGGLSAELVALSALVLVTTCFQVGAYAVLNSTRMRTAAEAVSRTYVQGIGLLFLMGIFGSISMAFTMGVRMSRGGGSPGVGIFTALFAGGFGFMPAGALGLARFAGGPGWALVSLAPAWLWTYLCVRKARRLLVSHAFLPPKKRKKHTFFGNMIRYAKRHAARKRRQSVDDTRNLPEDHPVLWRDTVNTYLEWPHGVRGMLVIIMAPLLLLVVPIVLLSRHGEASYTLSFFVATTWIIGGIAVLARSAVLFAEERSKQTLPILLTTPLSGAQIVRQKARVPWRQTLLLAAPLGTLFIAEAIIEFRLNRPGDVLAQLAYLALSALSVFVLLPTLYWAALLIGVKIQNRTRASVVAMLAVLAWNFGPSMLMGFFPRSLRWLAGILGFISPWRIISIAERGFTIGGRWGYWSQGQNWPAFTAALAGLAVNAGLLLLVRHICLSRADRYLGRPVANWGKGRSPVAETVGGDA